MENKLKQNVYWLGIKASLDVYLDCANEKYDEMLEEISQLDRIPFECNHCGDCCNMKNHAVFLCIRDLKNWVDNDRWDILAMVRGSRNKSDKNRFMPVFPGKHQEKPDDPFVTTMCVFYDDVTDKCTIHDDKPLACQIYPLTYEMTKRPSLCDRTCFEQDISALPSTEPMRLKRASLGAFDEFMWGGSEYQREKFWMVVINTIHSLSTMKVSSESPMLGGVKEDVK